MCEPGAQDPGGPALGSAIKLAGTCNWPLTHMENHVVSEAMLRDPSAGPVINAKNTNLPVLRAERSSHKFAKPS